MELDDVFGLRPNKYSRAQCGPATGCARAVDSGARTHPWWRRIFQGGLAGAIRWLATRWIHRQQRRYRSLGEPLSLAEQQILSGFFRPEVLELVRVHALPRLEDPWFVRWLRWLRLPLDFSLSQAAGVTYGDTIVLAGSVDGVRSDLGLVFHELVHVVQYHQLGVDGFIEQYVRGWIEGGFRYMAIPLEIQAYVLEDRYRRDPKINFAVEGAVRTGLQPNPQPTEAVPSSD